MRTQILLAVGGLAMVGGIELDAWQAAISLRSRALAEP